MEDPGDEGDEQGTVFLLQALYHGNTGKGGGGKGCYLTFVRKGNGHEMGLDDVSGAESWFKKICATSPIDLELCSSLSQTSGNRLQNLKMQKNAKTSK